MIPWDKIHGAMTHFPIALLLFSTTCDFVSVTFRKLTFAQELRLVSFYGLAVAALASFGAVISGIALTKGDLWGRGYFAWHHRFVWPAFGLLVALAVWRLVARKSILPCGTFDTGVRGVKLRTEPGNLSFRTQLFHADRLIRRYVDSMPVLGPKVLEVNS
jgi:hypothetical protein